VDRQTEKRRDGEKRRQSSRWRNGNVDREEINSERTKQRLDSILIQ
jgi:hypothetical protein